MRSTIPQIIRYQKINTALNRWKNGRVSLERLVKICASSKRTIERDISYLRSTHDAPIKCDKEGYYYTKPFDIPQFLALNQSDLNKLNVAVETLNQFKELEVFSGIKSVFNKIEQSVKFKAQESHKGKYIIFEKLPQYEGTRHIDFILNAIDRKISIGFNYHSFHANTVKNHHIYPYVIKEHTNRWYLLGYNPAKQSITTFALDRIQGNLEITNEYFDIPTTFNVEEHLKEVVGMTVRNKPVEEVVLKFAPLQSLYFLSKPFHEFERIKEDDTGLTVQMQLIPNYELKQKLASFGNGVKVLQPQSLAEGLKQFLKNAYTQYE